MKILYFVLFVISFHYSLAVNAQNEAFTLSAKEVAAIVQQFHPVVQQARIRTEQAEANITTARGGFDPLLQTTVSEKVFDGKEYYHYTQPELKIPTWYGIELQAGTAYISGDRTDPQATLGRTSYVGISVPVLKNLLIDKRRAALQQAKIIRQQTEAEKSTIVNNILRDALYSYWNWQQQYTIKKIADQMVATNEKRYRLVKTAYQLGERPAVDTAEALTQLQEFLVMQQQALLDLQNATVDLSFYLWQKGNEPYDLPQQVQPKAQIANRLEQTSIDSLLMTAAAAHPILQQYKYKLDVLTVERKLKFQELLPGLNVKYNHLNRGYNMLKAPATPLLHNNYQYGISFSMPLRLSAGRGAYRKARLDIAYTELEMALKQQEITNKIKEYYNSLQALQAQVAVQQKAVDNYATLLRAEEVKFFSGESSLFLINRHENKLLEARQKLLALQTKHEQTMVGLQWATGTLSQSYN